MRPILSARTMTKLSLLISLAGFFGPGMPLPAQASDQVVPTHRPNILLVITDQQSADALSCRQGDRWLKTPNMDSLAARGTFFTRAYAANPICIPSRTAMFTGRYPHETGIQNNERVAFDVGRFPTMGTFFRQAGYDTGYVGKWHLLTPIENAATSGRRCV